jgi:UDP-N-acetylglucosamine 2-epimerase
MRIAVITTSRADWPALGMVACALREEGHQVTVLATAHHDGIEAVRADVFAPVSFDCWLTAQAAVMALHDWNPDWAIVLGDRWETLLVAFACKYTASRSPI